MFETDIAICSTVHQFDDPRIFHRQAKFLSNLFNIRLYICAPFNRRRINSRLEVIGLHLWIRKIDRLLNIFLLIKHLLNVKAKIFIFHDPELLGVILFVKIIKRGLVIYDIHENYYEMIVEKLWIPRILRNVVGQIYQICEKIALKYTDMIWYPVKDIGYHYDKYPHLKKLLVRNIPDLTLFRNVSNLKETKKNQLIYIGTMVEDRGIKELVNAFSIFRKNFAGYKLILVGTFKSKNYKDEVHKQVKTLNLEEDLIILEKIPYPKIPLLLSQSKLGVINFLPTQNNIKGLPNKLFEYMAAGIPVLASNFHNYQKIIESHQAGICVDPTDSDAIASAMASILENEKQWRMMGINGKQLVEYKYDWKSESVKITQAIQDLIAHA